MIGGGKVMSGREDVTIQRRQVMCDQGYFRGYDNNQENAERCAMQKTEATQQPHLAFICDKDPFGSFDSFCVVKKGETIAEMFRALKALLMGVKEYK